MKLKFKGTEGFESYHGHMGSWNDGDEKEVPDDIANGLLSSMPNNFFEVEEAKKEKGIAPEHDRLARSRKNK